MAEARTQQATVKRLAGQKGVVVEEVKQVGERQFSNYFTVWLGDGHGLNVGDSARFYGELSSKRDEKPDKTYFEMVLSNAQVLEGSLVRAAPDADSWDTTEPGTEWH